MRIYTVLICSKFGFNRITGPISIKLGTKHSWVKGIQRSPLCTRGDNNEITNTYWQNSLKILLHNHWANFNQTWHNAFQGKWILVYSNEGPFLSPMGDYNEIDKIHWQNWKNSFCPEQRDQFQPDSAQFIRSLCEGESSFYK